MALLKKLWSGADFWDKNENKKQRDQFAQQQAQQPQGKPLWQQAVQQATNKIPGVSVARNIPVINKAISATETGLARSLTGGAQGVSGLYDLATPGTGTNRFTKATQTMGAQQDQFVKNNGLNKALYKGGQLGGEALQFVGPGMAVDALANTNKVGKVIQSGRNIKSAPSLIPESSNLLARGARWATKPSTLINVGTNTLQNSGYRTAQGQDVSPRSIATDLATSLAFGGALEGAGKAVGAVGNKGAALISNKLNRPKPLKINEGVPVQTNKPLQIKAGVPLARDPRTPVPTGFKIADNSVPPVNRLKIKDNSVPQQPRGAVLQSILGKARQLNDNLGQGGYVANPFGKGDAPEGQWKDKVIGDNTFRVFENGKTSEMSSLAAPETKLQQKVSLKDSQSPATSALQKSGVSSSDYNTSNLQISKGEQANARKLVKELQPQLEKRIGKKLSNKEAIDLADNSGVMQQHGATREQTTKAIAANLKLRQKITAGLKEDKISAETIQAMLEDKAAGADIARQLQARRIMAKPQDRPILDLMIEKIQKAGVATDEVVAASQKYDLNDPKQQADFYRQFVKPKASEWLDKYRYSNMLSSPLTHIVNISSNAQGLLGVSPIQKLYEGGIDAAKSALTGKERTRFAGEAGAYLKGVKNSFGDARQAFTDAARGVEANRNPDLDALRNIPLATHGVRGTVDKILSVTTRLLEASDRFGTTLAQGGETAALAKRSSKGVNIPDISGESQKLADYRLFRQQLGNKDQGYMLQAIDAVPQAVQKWRNSDNPIIANTARFTFPFISTPTNIFKQGIEYSPFGIATLPGNKDKIAQAAKSAMGTTIMGLSAGALAAGGDITFNEPSDAEQRAAFRAEGKQPYSVKIGDKWYSYSKLHPAIAFNLAVVGAVKEAEDNQTIDKTRGDQILASAAGIINFYTDQSYMKSVGDFSNALQSKDGSSWANTVANQASNTVNQLVPFKSLTSWIGRQIDPTQRKVDYSKGTLNQIKQNVVKDIPGLNNGVPTRDNPYTGQPLKNPNPILNSFSPVRVTTDQGFGKNTGLNLDQRQQLRALPKNQQENFRMDVLNQKATERMATKEKDAVKNNGDGKQLSDGSFYGKIGDKYKSFDSKQQFDEAKAKDDFEKSGAKSKMIGDTYFYKTKAGKVETKDKYEYEYDSGASKRKLAFDRANASNNLETWAKTAQEEYDALEKLKGRYDSETESDKIDAITLKQENLADKLQGYLEKGYIRKGKGSGGSKIALDLVSKAGTVETPRLAQTKKLGVSAPAKLPQLAKVKTPTVRRPRNRTSVTSRKTYIA